MNYITDLSEFGFALLKARRLRSMTQDEVSKKAGICKATIGNLERGKGKPNSKSERALKKLFPEVFGWNKED